MNKRKKIIKRISPFVGLMFLLVAFTVINCGKTKRVRAVITGYEKESGKWQGCTGTDWKTCIKTIPDNYVDHLCGKYGAIGDTISGWWTEGHWDGQCNGFHRSN